MALMAPTKELKFSARRVGKLRRLVKKFKASPSRFMLAIVELAPASLRAACQKKMKSSGEKHSRGSPDSLKEKEAKQPKPSDSPDNQKISKEHAQPTEREIKAARAARERLYGDKAQQKETEEEVPKLPTGPEPTATIEVEYPPSADLEPLEEPPLQMEEALKGMADSDWQVATPALILLRRLTIHHSTEVWQHITDVMPLVLKSIKSLRSSLSKTAIMSVADVIRTFKEETEPFLNKGGVSKPASSLLYQLLLKGSSNDKRFVVEEAKATLTVMAENITPGVLLQHILPYAEHKSPKIRGAASTVLLACTEKLSEQDWTASSIEQLLKVAGKLVSDNTPEARNAAKKVLVALRSAHAAQAPQVEGKENAPEEKGEAKENASEEKAEVTGSSPQASAKGVKQAVEGGKPPKELPTLAPTWEAQCQKSLGASRALAVLKATGTSEQ